MTNLDYLIAEKLKGKMAQIVSLMDFKIFGSRARGEDSTDSDMDIFIEMKYIDDVKKERLQELSWEIGYENDIVISLLIFTENEIMNSPMRSSPIIKNIYSEGITI